MPAPKKPDVTPEVRKTLDDVRGRLTSDPSRDELERMQLHMDVLSKWDRMMMRPMAKHDHDHMDDHDHEP
jgi:hypothetical protein